MDKTLVLIMVLLVGVFVSLLGGLSLSDDIGVCYERTVNQTNKDRMTALSSYWRKKKACRVGREVYGEYEICIRKVVGEWDFMMAWFKTVARVLEPVVSETEKIWAKHNEDCAIYPDLMIPY